MLARGVATHQPVVRARDAPPLPVRVGAGQIAPMPRAAARIAAPLAAALLAIATAAAQRPAPPRDWRVDTAGATVRVVRQGGMMSTTTEGKLVGPWRIAGDAARFLEATGAADAEQFGTIDPSATGSDAARDETIGGRRVLTRAFAVRDARGAMRYVAYRLVVPERADAPVWLMRLVFADALTMVRVARSGFEALQPYAVEPPATLRTLATLEPPSRATDRVASAPPLAAPTPTTTTPARTPSRATERGAPTTPTTAPATGRATTTGRHYFRFAYRAGGVAGVYVFVPYFLRDDGVAIEAMDVPPELFDEAAARRTRPDDFLRWRRGGRDTILVTDRRGATDAWTGDEFFEALPAARGQRITAVYRATSSFMTPDMTTSVVSSSTAIALRADGTFSTDAATSASGSSGGGSVFSGRTDSSRGTYELDGHTITLRSADGRVQRLVFFIHSEKGRPDLTIVCIGGRTYLADSAR
jgi:hypothetical protein